MQQLSTLLPAQQSIEALTIAAARIGECARTAMHDAGSVFLLARAQEARNRAYSPAKRERLHPSTKQGTDRARNRFRSDLLSR
jgi:hypothetical protein